MSGKNLTKFEVYTQCIPRRGAQTTRGFRGVATKAKKKLVVERPKDVCAMKWTHKVYVKALEAKLRFRFKDSSKDAPVSSMKEVPWKEVRNWIHKVQVAINKAIRNNKLSLAHELQRMLTDSAAAKFFAVSRVTMINAGKRSAGVDNNMYISGMNITDTEKVALACQLCLDRQASLGTPTVENRAKQYLCVMALEPEWEAKYVDGANSFGFRPRRRPWDATQAIYAALRHRYPRYVYAADLTRCFDNISHLYLLRKLDTFDSMRAQVKAFLEAGVMKGYSNPHKEREVGDDDKRAPQVNLIAPLLCNIALDGLGEHLKQHGLSFWRTKFRGEGMTKSRISNKKLAYTRTRFVRYADDFIVTHSDKEVIESMVQKSKNWLRPVGLTINEEKIRVLHATQGFDFLGYTFITHRDTAQPFRNKRHRTGPLKFKHFPSQKSQDNIVAEIKRLSKIWTQNIGQRRKFIKLAASKLLGWRNYYRNSQCSMAFKSVNWRIIKRLMKRTMVLYRRSKAKGRFERIFPSNQTYVFMRREYRNNWIMSTLDKNGKPQDVLPNLEWIASIDHVKVEGAKSPYDGDIQYWTWRMKLYGPYTPYVGNLLLKQKAVCPLCQQPIRYGEPIEVDHVIAKALSKAKGKQQDNSYLNLAAVHQVCHALKTKKDIAEIARLKRENKIAKTKVKKVSTVMVKVKPKGDDCSLNDMSYSTPGVVLRRRVSKPTTSKKALRAARKKRA